MDEKLRNNLWNYKADKKFQSFAKIELQLKKSSKYYYYFYYYKADSILFMSVRFSKNNLFCCLYPILVWSKQEKYVSYYYCRPPSMIITTIPWQSKFEIAATSVTTVSPTHTKNLLYYYIENVPTTMIVCHDYYYYYSTRFRDSILFHTSGHFKQLLNKKSKFFIVHESQDQESIRLKSLKEILEQQEW